MDGFYIDGKELKKEQSSYFSNQNQQDEVTVIVLTYNPLWDKLKLTIDSIICQEDVIFSLIIADDGSENPLFERTSQYLMDKSFSKFEIKASDNNRGTVKNAINGLKSAKGVYSKLISPGDVLAHKHILREWLDYMGDSPWSFSDALYVDEYRKVISAKAHPQDIKIYANGNDDIKRWQYVVLNDIALGAAIIGKTDLQLYYCSEILKAGVKYAEDNMWRLMMFDGIVGKYYPQCTIIYEFGMGVSTTKNKLWKHRLDIDWDATSKLMIPKDRFQAKMVKSLNNKNLFNKLFIKNKFKYWIKINMFERKTKCK